MPTRRELANAIRVLAMDAVQKANSGHPGMPMGMADIAEVLWRDFLKFNPLNPNWANRDRFILSNGHGALLQYALLHLSGFDLSMDDLRQFRQLHSKTPGHPELGETPGIETTTGPLGQGLANGVGMALAEQILATQFNREGYSIVDHYTYVFAGDGDLMEGISHEACSLAGTWGLGKLIVLYDDNGISIDGDVQEWFTDNTPERFRAYHWHVIADIDGHNPEQIRQAIEEARLVVDRPSLLCCKTQIGYGSPNLAGSSATHGAPLGEAEVELARKNLNWAHEPFKVSEEIYQAWDGRAKGEDLEQQWNDLFAKYKKTHPQLASEFQRRINGDLPEQWHTLSQQLIEASREFSKDEATRKSSLRCLNALAPALPELVGGSADLSESNCTKWDNSHVLNKNKRDGNYIEYGVREFAMSAIMNGITLHQGIIPFGGTFLTFADYARNAVRLAALMKQRVIFIYSHDSIGLGEDGPTHQPIEHIAMLRMTPGLKVWRPADWFETAIAWQMALQHQGPSCLLLTRQAVPQQPHNAQHDELARRGGYILFQTTQAKKIDGIFIATGSEVGLAVQAAQDLSADGFNIRVVSMPCCELFKEQEISYRDHVLPRDVKLKIAIETGAPDYWYQFVGDLGKVIGLNHFGASAPIKDLLQEFGFTREKIKQTMLDVLNSSMSETKCNI